MAEAIIIGTLRENEESIDDVCVIPVPLEEGEMYKVEHYDTGEDKFLTRGQDDERSYFDERFDGNWRALSLEYTGEGQEAF